MSIPAGYTQGPQGFFWKSSDNSGPYCLNPDGTLSTWGGSGSMPTPVAASSNVSSAAYANSLIIKASLGTLRNLNGYNSSSAPQFIQLHDAAAVPADGAVPVAVLYVGGQENFSFDYQEIGRAFANGIVACNSSTGPTKTIGAANCWFDAQI